jgi:V/A-type H+-transporting ATPase subunit K
MNIKKRFYLSLTLLQIFLGLLAFFIIDGLTSSVLAQGEPDPATNMVLGISAAGAIVGSSLAAAMVIKTVGTAAVSAIAENPNIFMRAFLIIAMGEALAIYGLIVSILLWLKIV